MDNKVFLSLNLTTILLLLFSVNKASASCYHCYGCNINYANRTTVVSSCPPPMDLEPPENYQDFVSNVKELNKNKLPANVVCYELLDSDKDCFEQTAVGICKDVGQFGSCKICYLDLCPGSNAATSLQTGLMCLLLGLFINIVFLK